MNENLIKFGFRDLAKSNKKGGKNGTHAQRKYTFVWKLNWNLDGLKAFVVAAISKHYNKSRKGLLRFCENELNPYKEQATAGVVQRNS